jgi:hypothetical protein
MNSARIKVEALGDENEMRKASVRIKEEERQHKLKALLFMSLFFPALYFVRLCACVCALN